MADLFRKSALEKLSSPEQLDRAIEITPPSFWVALTGGMLIILGALLWGVFGRLPVNVDANGIFVSGDGTSSVFTEASGVVSEVTVKEGIAIKKGEVIAYVSDGEITSEIENLGKRIEAVEKITLDSTNDETTADNKALIDLKTEVLSLTTAYKQTKSSLEQKKKELEKKKKLVAQLKGKADAEKKTYYNSLGSDTNAQAQLDYSEAQSELSMRQQYYESAYSAMQQAGSAQSQARAAYDTYFAKYQTTLISSNNAYADYEAMNGQYEAQQQTVNDLIAAMASEEEIQAAQTVLTTLEAQTQQAYQIYQTESTGMSNAEAALNQAETNLYSTDAAYQTAVDTLKNCENNLNIAKNNFNAAKVNYTAALNSQQAESKAQNTRSNEYSQAMSEYNTEKNMMESLEQTVNDLKSQVKNAAEDIKVKKKQMNTSFSSTKASILDQLKSEMEKYTKNLKKYEILSTQEGTVQEIMVASGMIVGQGSEILKVKQGESQRQEVLCYIPVSTGKKVNSGMEVMLFPTTINQQEYGHMSGMVKEVANYVTSQSEIKKRLGEDSLVNAFMQSGPVVEVVCTIKEDPDTASGYHWSSNKGKDIILTEGTMLEAKIVTEKKAPITMLLPYLKEKLTKLSEPVQAGADTAQAGV